MTQLRDLENNLVSGLVAVGVEGDPSTPFPFLQNAHSGFLEVDRRGRIGARVGLQTRVEVEYGASGSDL